MVETRGQSQRIPVYALFTAAVVLCLAVAVGRISKESNAPQALGLNSSHWAMFALARLSGLPLAIGTVREKLIPDDNGHSLVQIRQALDDLGINARLEEISIDEVRQQQLPAIVQISNPHHFVVLTAIQEESLFMFGPDGTRRVVPKESIRNHWTGRSLVLEVRTPEPPTSGPRIVFESLVQERGFVKSMTGEVKYTFPVRNSGMMPLELAVSSNCDCKVVEGKNQRLKPGESSTVSVSYTMNPLKPSFSESVRVDSNDPVHPHLMLSFSGSSTGGVRVSNRSIDFGVIRTGRKLLRTISAVYSSDFSFTDADWEASEPWLSIKPITPNGKDPTSAEDSQSAEFLIELDPANLPSGRYTTLVLLRSADGEVLVRIPVACYKL